MGKKHAGKYTLMAVIISLGFATWVYFYSPNKVEQWWGNLILSAIAFTEVLMGLMALGFVSGFVDPNEEARLPFTVLWNRPKGKYSMSLRCYRSCYEIGPFIVVLNYSRKVYSPKIRSDEDTPTN